MLIRRCGLEDLDDWARFRTALWPGEGSFEDFRRDAAELLARSPDKAVAFLLIDDAGKAAGFVEARLRHDPVNGCETSPVAFLEGIYVVRGRRRQGGAKALCAAVEAWARELGCRELGSDALVGNRSGHAFHLGAGFEEQERVVCFRKRL